MVAINTNNMVPLWMMDEVLKPRVNNRNLTPATDDPYHIFYAEKDELKAELLEELVSHKTNQRELTEEEKMDMIDFETWCNEELSDFMYFDSFGLDDYDEWGAESQSHYDC